MIYRDLEMIRVLSGLFLRVDVEELRRLVSRICLLRPHDRSSDTISIRRDRLILRQ